MKNATQFHIRPARPDEAGLFYTPHPEEDKRLGTVGHVRMDFGRSGNEFWHTWWPRGPEELNSPAFKLELQEVVDTLRESVLKNRFAMERFCYEHGGKISGGWTQNYGYVVVTEHYRYCLRCNPSPGDYNGYPTFELWYDEIAAAMQNATMIPSFAEYAPRWCDTIELRRNAAGSYTATVTDDNEVLGDYNFAANSGSGITFTRKGNTLTITATAAAAKNLDTEKTYSATGSAYEIDPDRAVICWYDRTGRYQAMAGYTGVGRDPVKAYIKIKAVEEKGSITVRKVDVTGSPLAGAELLLETSADGQTWTEVGKITTDKAGIAKWSDLKVGVQYRVTETKAPAGYLHIHGQSRQQQSRGAGAARHAVGTGGCHGQTAPVRGAGTLLAGGGHGSI